MAANNRKQLQQLTKAQLINKILQLQTKNSPKNTVNKQKINFDKYGSRRIALKIAYVGWDYSGFASHNKSDEFTIENKDNFDLDTVEDHVFKALLTLNLIKDRAWCNYSLAGRTDKEVSGVGQVISLRVRSNLQQEEIDADHQILKSSVTNKEEYNYAEMISRLTPLDIQILKWAPVDESFNARFSCTSRQYKYFFFKQNLDIDLMNLACTKLIGEHDFRNLCRRNPSKINESFIRNIYEAKITKCSNINIKEENCYEFNIIGSGFLWNQVRNIMSVLFLVGMKLESPSIIDCFLDDKLEGKPVYELASGLPLLFYKAEYGNINIQWQNQLNNISLQKMYLQFYQNQVKKFIFCNVFEKLATDPNSHCPKESCIQLGAGKFVKFNKYKMLMDREQLLSIEEYQKLQQKKAKINK